MNRVRDGFVLIRNPFNAHQIRRVSLLQKDVEAIVFWTRNAENLTDHLPYLDSQNYKYYFQYTITGYPRSIEKAVPKTLRAIETFCKISEMIGSGRIVWRYDPILVSSLVDIEEHKRLFSKIAAMLEGKTTRVVISFADIYKKTERNLNTLSGFQYKDITLDVEQLLNLAEFMSSIAAKHGMEIQSCAEQIDLESVNIAHGKCIDEGLIKSEFGLTLNAQKDSGQREECGCIKSIDIGQYNTCLHGCAYCYATFNEKTVIKNKRQHDPLSPFLIGAASEEELKLINSHAHDQGALF
jgi:hypothetical protein